MARSTSNNEVETPAKAARRTPREIAQANLDEAKAKLEKVENRKARLTSDLERADAQIAELTEEVEWLAGRPALRKTDGEPVSEVALAALRKTDDGGAASEVVEDGALAAQDA